MEISALGPENGASFCLDGRFHDARNLAVPKGPHPLRLPVRKEGAEDASRLEEPDGRGDSPEGATDRIPEVTRFYWGRLGPWKDAGRRGRREAVGPAHQGALQGPSFVIFSY